MAGRDRSPTAALELHCLQNEGFRERPLPSGPGGSNGSIPELRDAGKRSPFPGIVAATQITARADFLSDSAFPVDCPLLSHQTLSSRIQLVILPAKTAFRSRLLNDADPEFLGATAT